MSPSVPKKIQARMLLRTMCKFLLPLIQTPGGQTRKNAKRIPSGIGADAFISALENFISGMIPHSQLSSRDISIEATLVTDAFDYLEGTNWLWDIPALDDKAGIDGGSNNEVAPYNRFRDSRMISYEAIPRPMYHNTEFEDNPRLKLRLQALRRYIMLHMPIRLLCFEPHNSGMKISLLERGDLYDYIIPKLQAIFHDTGHLDVQTISKHTKYAILSHTWTYTGEMTYDDWHTGSFSAEHPKFQKLVTFCKVAWEDHRLNLGWIDTVCINKESSAELDESIRSMYAWYSKAAICITYLAETNDLSDMKDDRWFKRGWTFQELVAPNHIKFYSKNWRRLTTSSSTDKEDPSIQKSIQEAISITPDELKDIRSTSISRRMELAAERQVTREEDIAYSLMGIFNVSISTAYGEGPVRAFHRLIKEIFDSTRDVLDIFNWGGAHPFRDWTPITSLFPSSPGNFLSRSRDLQLRLWHPLEPLTLTHMGLRTPVLLMPAISSREVDSTHPSIGDYYATVSLYPTSNESDNISIPDSIHHLPDNHVPDTGDIKWKFGALNVERDGTGIRIPKTCFAVLLAQQVHGRGMDTSLGYRKIYTRDPIIFELKKKLNQTYGESDDNTSENYYHVEESQLENHGMKLVTLYL